MWTGTPACQASVMHLACQEATPARTDTGGPGSVAMPRSDWQDFIAGLDRSMDRIVPEVSDGQLVGIRYFYVGVPQAARLGLTSGDRFVAVNDTKVQRPQASRRRLLDQPHSVR